MFSRSSGEDSDSRAQGKDSDSRAQGKDSDSRAQGEERSPLRLAEEPPRFLTGKQIGRLQYGDHPEKVNAMDLALDRARRKGRIQSCATEREPSQESQRLLAAGESDFVAGEFYHEIPCYAPAAVCAFLRGEGVDPKDVLAMWLRETWNSSDAATNGNGDSNRTLSQHQHWTDGDKSVVRDPGLLPVSGGRRF